MVVYVPFAIKLLYGSYGYTQNTNLDIDLGFKNIGVVINFDVNGAYNILRKHFNEDIEINHKILSNVRKIYIRTKK